MRALLIAALGFLVCCGAPAQMVSSGQLMYIGTLDKKLLVFDEDKEEVVGEIPLSGIPRVTALSADQKTLYIFSTRMELEIVDLIARKETGSFSLADPRSHPRMVASSPDRVNIGGSARFSGLAVDPQGNYLYTTLRVVTKDIDQYRVEDPQFVAIDLHDLKIAKSWPFPKSMDQGFGFNATFKVSPDGKMLYVFQDDVLVFDLSNFTQVDKIALSKPTNPGSTPYRLAETGDTFDTPDTVTSVFTSVDDIVHKGTLGMATMNLNTRKVEYFPIGPLLPMMGFLISPDHKRGYSVMPKIGVGENRYVEWWVWDINNHSVINKKEFEGRTTFRFAVGGDGKHLYVYGAGSTLEVFDAATLASKKVIYLNRDTTTNIIAPVHRSAE
jgi:DNA-binding beta-propeller fold protein YncE